MQAVILGRKPAVAAARVVVLVCVGTLGGEAPATALKAAPCSEIAFASSCNRAAADIYVMKADGKAFRRLTRSRRGDLTPAWSPDGTKIAFRSDRDGNDEIYVMNADGSQQRNLTRSPTIDYSPAWSPDGKQIAFARGETERRTT